MNEIEMEDKTVEIILKMVIQILKDNDVSEEVIKKIENILDQYVFYFVVRFSDTDIRTKIPTICHKGGMYKVDNVRFIFNQKNNPSTDLVEGLFLYRFYKKY